MNTESYNDDQDDVERHGYDGADRRSWEGEARVLHKKLASIEKLAKDTHDSIISHVAEERQTKAAIDELILLWRGSKLMVAALKITIPIIAALAGGAIWLKDHVKWHF